jgi:hypothetical protein
MGRAGVVRQSHIPSGHRIAYHPNGDYWVSQRYETSPPGTVRERMALELRATACEGARRRDRFALRR